MARILHSESLQPANQAIETALPSQVAQRPRHESSIEWELSRKLQTSLDIKQLLNYFFEAIQAELSCAHFCYEHPESEIECKQAKAARHTCNYQLTLADESLGRLQFSRGRRFTSAELHRIEDLLCLLVYPLRNALLYKSALQQAMRDTLTGTLNRAAYDTMLAKEIDIARRHDTPLSLLVLDIDHFKKINDTYGHAMGDNALKAMVKRINSKIRSSDILFRYGGEEFTIVLNNTGIDGARLLAERIREAIEEMVYINNDVSMRFTVSIGISTLTRSESGDSLFDRADKALYKAKRSGRNQVLFAG
ncbi:GGDEF domain-containing protein [Sulfuriflexus sp.]|uniref:GGDEF domain-containing protein n=1 Tax=Sulfuriflexus sp. TaxID=2015443 RepID=UPI0028CF73EC|nr:GGDEF domain-containing protein [Sulfuriflexus sp.]MDT8403725.1 GGDEF domain-containing protein [Sulfuriflexus sp.]